MINIIPAIDIINGKCVRLTGGDYNTAREYFSDPYDAAMKFYNLGYRRLHIVDLDGAASKGVVNIETLRRICSIPGMVVDFGGGVKSDRDIEKVFDAGAAMVTAGSIAVTSPETVEGWLMKYGPEKIILGADVRGTAIAVNGWKENTDHNIVNFLDYWTVKGITKVISTQVSRDGTLSGPDLALYMLIISRFPNLTLIASGGVSSQEDLDDLRDIGVKEVIVGKAIYENRITLPVMDTGMQEETVARRIIPCLDIKDGRVVKGVKFGNLKDAGDPVQLARTYSDDGADELVFLDITATHQKRKTMADLVRRVAESINIPFTVGGGITSVEDVSVMLSNGADKVSLNSAAMRDPALIDRLAATFGSQCVVIAVDASCRTGVWEVYLDGGITRTGIMAFDWLDEATSRGAGEILFTSMDHDGVRNGFATEAIAEISRRYMVPVIASGGAGSMQHFLDVFREGGADAALAASLFHYGELTVPRLKEYLHSNSVPVRI